MSLANLGKVRLFHRIGVFFIFFLCSLNFFITGCFNTRKWIQIIDNPTKIGHKAFLPFFVLLDKLVSGKIGLSRGAIGSLFQNFFFWRNVVLNLIHFSNLRIQIKNYN